jgi:cellulose synthase/poly-beta-1,6-N-acetylglucosamine synthase-like glycosyltransferase
MSAQVRAVIVGFGCGPYLDRCLSAWEVARETAGIDAETVVVLPPGEGAPDLGKRARVIEVGPDQSSTPGANRNRGAEGATTDWLLFLDGDVELMRGFVAHALEAVAERPRVAGFGGRLDEKHWQDGRLVGGARDLYRIADGGEVPYLAQAWLCRRVAFENVGGFDARLPAEEDFELGARLRRAGWLLLAEPDLAGVHHCAPRPSIAEIKRRWKNGMFAGPGLALRHAKGTPLFGELLRRQWLYLGTLAYAVFGLLALVFAPIYFVLWTWGLLFAWGLLALRKRNARLAGLSLLTWAVQGAALVRVWLLGPWGTMGRGGR